MTEETETYKRYENKGCPCWCGKHCGSSCMTDGCDCTDCECFECQGNIKCVLQTPRGV